MAKIFQGKSKQWQLGDTPIGSGDAGEVYSAVCVDAPEIAGVVKKPARVATGGTIQRQAGQIAQEAQALVRLDGLPQGKAHPPRLLDEAPPFTQGTANYFIVSESAPGEALDAMLSQTRQEGKPFPRRVIITVLDALFDLFARAHQAGVLWNDVKLDHIYWHNPTGTVTVIDWGNALFLDQPQSSARRTPPRWEDYRQFLETLGNFIQGTAPELYADLGWDDFAGTDLDLPTISILARRIAYQQEVIALKEMEYRALIQVALSAEPDIQGLADIQEYQQILETIGAPWPRQDVLSYGSKLLKQLALGNQRQASLRVVSLVFDLFGEDLDLPWHLLREIFRQPDLMADPNLGSLVIHILQENWGQALWHLVSIASIGNEPSWWTQIIPVVRQKAIGLITPPPYEICQEAINRLRSSHQPGQDAFAPGQPDQQQWRQQGTAFRESPFDYPLLESLSEEKSLPPQLRTQVRTSQAAGKEAIRELFQSWVNMDWESIRSKIQQVLAWDPDRWALLHLDEEISQFQNWLQRLYEGPLPGTSPHEFFESLQQTQPHVHRVLGQPPWFKSLMLTVSQLTQHDGPKPPLQAAKNWCPWILTYAHPNLKAGTALDDDAAITQTLRHFESHLRSWSDIEAGLEAVRTHAPAYHPACKNIAEGFQKALSLNFMPDSLNHLCKQPPHPALEETCLALSALTAWRTELSSQDLATAAKIICKPEFSDWQVMHHACESTRHWHQAIHPRLSAMFDPGLSDEANEGQTHDETLTEISIALEEIKAIWSRIYQSGIHRSWMETLEEAVDGPRVRFLAWRSGFEGSNDPLIRLLYQSYLNVIRQNASRLLKLSRHIHLARLSFSETQKKALPWMSQLNTLEKVLTHLAIIEKILVRDETAREIPAWQDLLEQILDTPSSEARRKVVLSLPGDHPLYTWLLDAVF